MICALHYDRQENLPSERLKLYEECVDMMLRRDEVRKIATTDSPSLSLRQQQALLQALAYRMMRNGEIELSSELVDKLFGDLLPSFGADPNDAARVRAYFVERSNLLREPVVGQIRFVHRTFQEFFSAQAIVEDGEVGFLFQQANNEQWRDTFPLAAGMLRPREIEDLLQKLIIDGAPLPQRALALACLETAVQVKSALRQQVFAAVPELFPPYHPESQRMLAAAGEHAIPYLTRERQPNIAAILFCIYTLALIGGERALQAIEGYKDVDHDAVRQVIDDAWPRFDHREYARRLLKERREISVSDISLLPMLAELPQLQTLEFSGMEVSDLSFLAHVPQLQVLDLNNIQVSDVSGLSNLPQLQTLNLSLTQVSDLSCLTNLPQLQELNLNGTQVSDLSFLAHLPQLQTLRLNGTPLRDLSGLSNLPQLQTLYLSGTPLRDLSGLSNLPQLQTLYLSGTEVSDLSPLAQLPNLEGLDL